MSTIKNNSTGNRVSKLVCQTVDWKLKEQQARDEGDSYGASVYREYARQSKERVQSVMSLLYLEMTLDRVSDKDQKQILKRNVGDIVFASLAGKGDLS